MNLPDKQQPKFFESDLPKIMEAIKSAQEGRQAARLTIDFAENGGILAIHLESKKKFK